MGCFEWIIITSTRTNYGVLVSHVALKRYVRTKLAFKEELLVELFFSGNTEPYPVLVCIQGSFSSHAFTIRIPNYFQCVLTVCSVSL